LYAEAGAMRIPRVHDLTLGYIEHFGLQLRPFVMGNPKGLVHVGGRRMTAEQAGLTPDELGFAVADHERGRSASDLWEDATKDLKALLEADPTAGWEHIVREYDSYTLREFLELRGFSEGAIEMYGVMNFVEAGINNAVTEEFREDFGKAYEDMQEIVGGSDELPNAFYREIGDRVRFGAEVHGLCHGALQDRVRPVLGHRRLRDRHAPVLGAPPDRDHDPVLAREAARDPPAQLLRLDQGALPGQ
jgi:monoamine oxidase